MTKASSMNGTDSKKLGSQLKSKITGTMICSIYSPKVKKKWHSNVISRLRD